MSPNQVIAIVAFLVPSATAIVVAYLHRRQMRQIEAFKVDQTVGLHPPPHPVWSLVKSYWPLLGALVYLIAEVFDPRPLRRYDVVIIAFNFAGIVFFLVAKEVVLITNHLSRLINVEQSHFEATRRLGEATVLLTSKVMEGASADAATERRDTTSPPNP